MSKYVPETRKSDIVTQEFETEILIYDLRSQKAFCLNETASEVWQLCDGNRSVSDIAAILSSRSNIDFNEELVLLTLDQLKKDRLLETAAAAKAEFPQINRRQLIRKIGMASVIALPIISSLVAPSAIHAQSCIVNMAGCSNPGTFCAVASNMCCSCNCAPSAVPPLGTMRCA